MRYRAAFRIQKQSILLDTQVEMQRLYKAFYDVNVPVDVVPSDADISKYKVVLMPQMIIERPEFTSRIKSFVKNGGTAVMTYRTSVKDGHNNLTFGAVIPVSYDEFAGVSLVETESLQEGQGFPIIGKGAYEGKIGSGGIFRDMLLVSDAEVLYSYGDKFYTEYAAVTRKAQGDGMIYYLGCGLDDDTIKSIMNSIMSDNHIVTEESPCGVEICYRGTKENMVRVIMNHTAEEVSYKNMLLQPYDCRIEKC